MTFKLCKTHTIDTESIQILYIEQKPLIQTWVFKSKQHGVQIWSSFLLYTKINLFYKTSISEKERKFSKYNMCGFSHRW